MLKRKCVGFIALQSLIAVVALTPPEACIAGCLSCFGGCSSCWCSGQQKAPLSDDARLLAALEKLLDKYCDCKRAGSGGCPGGCGAGPGAAEVPELGPLNAAHQACVAALKGVTEPSEITRIKKENPECEQCRDLAQKAIDDKENLGEGQWQCDAKRMANECGCCAEGGCPDGSCMGQAE